ncbi:MAG: dihydroorotate dehydrogenase electron transfer subunit [Candidatus Dormibacteria bacterium]|jgi:dihydroorotate dehydrogenase electron transfer subunit
MSQTAAGTAAELIGESDLDRAVDEAATCLGVDPHHSNLFEISFESPGIARAARPGEFAQILVDEGPIPLLRRPFSFSRADPDSGLVAFYLGAVGAGSSRLRRFRPGDRARILGPLGRGFSLPDSPGRSIVVGGGLGAAPFPLLIDRLISTGEEVVWINGARSGHELYPERLLPQGITELVIRTEDGSRGERGLVTDGLAQRLAAAQRLYACGPNPMLAAVAALWREQRAKGGPVPPLEVSIEAPMGCGFGTCLGCAVPLRAGDHPGPFGLCCRQGPVLAADSLDWERLLTQPAHLG